MRLYEVQLTRKNATTPAKTVHVVAMYDDLLFKFLVTQFPEYVVQFGNYRVLDHNVFVAVDNLA